MIRVLILIAALFAAGPAAAQDFPAPSGRVVDQARIMSSVTEQSIAAKLASWEEQSSDQIIVVTVQSLGELTIEEYGVALGRAWGIGVAEGEDGRRLDNGIVLLVAPNERQVRIEVGYGLEGTMTDATSQLIISRVITPKFRAGDFDRGIDQGVDAILSVLKGEEAEWMNRRQRAGERPVAEGEDGFPWPILLFILFWILPMLLRKRRRVIFDSDQYARQYGDPAANALAWIIASQMAGQGRSRSGGWSSGGGFSGGGFSGGGFSGGGGSFGGGGASGSW